MIGWCARIAVLFMLVTSQAHSGNPAVPISINNKDKATLQRGAKFFMNYCAGCHSLRYLRYQRLAEDLDIRNAQGEVDESIVKHSLIFTKAQLQDTIQTSMHSEEARRWFGVSPPDLSLIARQKGGSWLYAYLNGFYVDETRDFGTNNALVFNVAMPDVFHNSKMSKTELDHAIRDLVAFLIYTAEPVRAERYQVGLFVLFFSGFFLLLVYCLKKNIWRALKK